MLYCIIPSKLSIFIFTCLSTKSTFVFISILVSLAVLFSASTCRGFVLRQGLTMQARDLLASAFQSVGIKGVCLQSHICARMWATSDVVPQQCCTPWLCFPFSLSPLLPPFFETKFLCGFWGMLIIKDCSNLPDLLFGCWRLN